MPAFCRLIVAFTRLPNAAQLLDTLTYLPIAMLFFLLIFRSAR